MDMHPLSPVAEAMQTAQSTAIYAYTTLQNFVQLLNRKFQAQYHLDSA
jgi:hypothetical protein